MPVSTEYQDSPSSSREAAARTRRVLRKALLLLALLSGAASEAAFAGRFVSSPPDAVPNRWLVLLEDSRELSEGAEHLPPVREVAEELLAPFAGKRPLHVFENGVRGFSVELPPQAARALSRSRGVALVEQDRLIHVQAPACPSVTFLPSSVFPANPQQISCPVFYSDNNCNDNWGLDRIDQQTPPLNGLFYFGGTGAGVHIYLLDTGIDYANPEFKNAQGSSRVGTSINFAGDGGHLTNPYYPSVTPTNYYDGYGHGTHVAAAAAGLRYGVAKSATLHAVRVTNSSAVSATSIVAQGVDWIARNHVKPAVVNISMNFSVAREEQNNPTDLNFMETLFRNLVQVYGVTVVNSAGNFNRDAYDFSPSRLSELIVVGASDYYDERWREAPAFEPCYIRQDPYSQCGSNFGSTVDLWAPGAFIVSTWPGGGSCRQTGTSLAAPLVTGVAATYLGTHPTALPADVAQALINNSSAGVLNGSTLGTAATPNRLLRTFP